MRNRALCMLLVLLSSARAGGKPGSAPGAAPGEVDRAVEPVSYTHLTLPTTERV